jgi:hypothetical protein
LISTVLLGVLTLIGSCVFAAQLVLLCRQRLALRRAQQQWTSPGFRDEFPACFLAGGVGCGGDSLPSDWVTERVRDLFRLRHGGYEAAAALCRLDRELIRQPLRMLYALAGATLLVGCGDLICPRLGAGSRPTGLPPTAMQSAGAALLGALWLIALSGLLDLLQRGMTSERERFTLLELVPALFVTDEQAAAERFAERLDASSRRLEATAQPLSKAMERLAERLQGSIEAFVPPLDHAAQNILHAVEGMRQSAADLRLGTSTFADSYTGVADIYARLEQLAGQVAGSQATQQERLSEVAGGLHGITESLTTVVAGANESRRVVAGMADGVAAAAANMERVVDRLQTSVDRLTTEFSTGKTAATSTEGVTLRRLVEQQQQFINLLDHRIGRVDPQTAGRR